MSSVNWQDGGAARIEVGGKSLELEMHGPAPGAADTIVMLHEGLGCAALWRDVPARIAQATGCGVAVYSRAGYGQSDAADLPRPLDYMTREAQGVLPGVLDAIGFRRGVLLGHSDGATIAVEYTGGVADHRVRGLILIAPHFFTEPAGLAAIARARKAYEVGDLRARMTKYHRDPDNAFRGWNDAWLDPGFAGWNVSDALDYLRVPVLVIQGRDDPYGSLAQVAEVQARSYAPVDVELLDGCAHAPHLEHPAQTLAAITSFTTRLQRIEAAGVEVA